MTTYDLYAAHALRLLGDSVIHTSQLEGIARTKNEDLAEWAFDLADAMMEERRKRKGQPKDDDMERRWCPVCKEWHTPLPPHLRGEE